MALWTPEFLQTKRYSAQRTRAMLQAMPLQEGVVPYSLSAVPFKVSQRAAGANMTVDIAGGDAWVMGDSLARQGLYHVVNDATFNLAVPANASGNPRLDQVVLKVNDTMHGGVGDTASLEIVQGTATGGATLDNRSGAAGLPNTAMRCADILVPASASSIVDANIRDRRQWALGARWFHQRPTSGATYSTTSLSYVAIDSTNLSRRVEVGPQGQVKVELHGYTNGPIESALLELFVNGVARGDTRIWTIPNTNYNMLVDITWYCNDLVGGGSYVFEPRWKSGSSGAINLINGAGTNPARVSFLIEEDLRPYTSNQ